MFDRFPIRHAMPLFVALGLGLLAGRWCGPARAEAPGGLRFSRRCLLISPNESCAVGDVDRVRFLTGRALIRMVEVVVLIVGVSILMMVMNLCLALLTMVIVPFLAYGALDFGPVSTRGKGMSAFLGCDRIPSRYMSSSAVPAPPGKMMMP